MAPLNLHSARCTDALLDAPSTATRPRPAAAAPAAAGGAAARSAPSRAWPTPWRRDRLRAGRRRPRSPADPAATASTAGAVGVGRRRRRAGHRRHAASTRPSMEDPELLGQLAASRAQRDAEQAAAAASRRRPSRPPPRRRGRGRGQGGRRSRCGRRGRRRPPRPPRRPRPPRPPNPRPPPRCRRRDGRVDRHREDQQQRRRPCGRRRRPPPTRSSATCPAPPASPSAAPAPARPTRAVTPPGWRWTTWSCPTRRLGDAIVAYHLAHWDELGVEYIIWQQRMLSSPGGSWKTMENRGSATANHMDHLHVNYR